MGHLVLKGDEAGQTGPDFHESMLAGSDPLAILHVLCDITQDDLLHNLASHQADRLTGSPNPHPSLS